MALADYSFKFWSLDLFHTSSVSDARTCTEVAHTPPLFNPPPVREVQIDLPLAASIATYFN